MDKLIPAFGRLPERGVCIVLYTVLQGRNKSQLLTLDPGIGFSVKRPCKNIKFIQIYKTESDFKSFMENNSRGQWGLKNSCHRGEIFMSFSQFDHEKTDSRFQCDENRPTLLHVIMSCQDR